MNTATAKIDLHVIDWTDSSQPEQASNRSFAQPSLRTSAPAQPEIPAPAASVAVPDVATKAPAEWPQVLPAGKAESSSPAPDVFTPEEIASATKLSLEVVQSLAALNTGDVRLDAPLDPDGDRSLIERFIAEDLPDTEDQAMDRFLSDEVESALNTLQRRDAKVLRLYFGLDGGREHTLEEIGGMLGVTRERVRQLRDRALKRLRDGEVGKALASFAA